jgi:N-acetylglucosamine-6-phosphate deacetylase
MKKILANIITTQNVFEGEISFDHKIISIKKINDSINNSLPYLLSGFVDLHIHGGGGIDIMEKFDHGPILKAHAKNGTTALLLTTVTAKQSDLVETFTKISSRPKNKGESIVLGIHLEGPYINRDKLGAQPDYVRIFSLSEIEELHKISPIKIMTLAPELFENNLITELLQKKVIVQIGHSNATYEEGLHAIESGAKSFTHLYNAMSALHHRSPGLVGCALAHAEYSELIPDLLHVHPGAIKAALRSIPKLYFVTDATSATGMPDGDYMLGAHHVSKCQNGVRLKDGTLAGSALTMIEAFKNLTSDKIGLSLSEASLRLSKIPCELLKIDHERGEIKESLFADFLIIDKNKNILDVYIEGEKI